MEIDQELLQGFIEEAKDNLEKVRQALDGYVESEDKTQRIESIYRGVHTIKGGSAMFGMNKLKDIAHALETKLGQYSKAPDTFDGEMIKKVKSIIDSFEDLLIAGPDKTPEEKEKELSQAPAPEQHLKSTKATTPQELIRVPLDRVQRNYDIVSEIFLIRNQMSHLMEHESAVAGVRDEFILKWEILDNSLRQRIIELENVVLSMRMMSVKSLFSRMEKTVESYCETSPKKIIVKTNGAETELDKKILDSLGDPLIHLIRNAMDHGIEDPEDRSLKGKPSQGTITLNARITGNEAVLDISDDGKGIDSAKIIEVAKNKGIDVSKIKTEDDAAQLIFAPGFSTAKEVTDVSGRGVGMDAVKTYVEKAGGKIRTKTKVDEGTTFSLHLPIGLSVIPAIVVRVGTHLYGIPTHDISLTHSLPRKEIARNKDSSFLNLNGKFMHCLFLGKEFDDTDFKDDQMNKKISICVAEIDGAPVAFVADSVESNTELISKPLPVKSPKFDFLSGVSLLATGEPAFILSLEKLHRFIMQSKAKKEVTRAA